MSEPFVLPTRDEFAEWIRDVLNRLYDSSFLQAHPLANLFAGEEVSALQRSQTLRRVLLEAIRAMRPAPGTPAQSPDWRAYRILELRYIEGLSPTEVMKQIALEKSHYFREQARVLEVLTDVLWNQWQKAHQEANVATEKVADTTREELARSETERLYAHATWEALDMAELLDDLRTVVEPLAKAQGGSVHLAPLHHLTVSHANRIMLRQAILNVVTYALDIARGGRVDISSFTEGQEMGIRVLAWRAANTESLASPVQRQGVGLNICRQLMAAMGGSLHLEARSADCWKARLVWPTSVPRVLLVIDDNEGFVDLFRRYLAGYNWQVIGVANGAEARRIIAETPPTVITLDVMMPQEDGWELLVSFKNDDRTRNIPVIVCSVLNEPQLALALGAAGYLPKPVTQPALLRALAPWSQAGASPRPAR